MTCGNSAALITRPVRDHISKKRILCREHLLCIFVCVNGTQESKCPRRPMALDYRDCALPAMGPDNQT